MSPISSIARPSTRQSGLRSARQADTRELVSTEESAFGLRSLVALLLLVWMLLSICVERLLTLTAAQLPQYSHVLTGPAPSGPRATSPAGEASPQSYSIQQPQIKMLYLIAVRGLSTTPVARRRRLLSYDKNYIAEIRLKSSPLAPAADLSADWLPCDGRELNRHDFSGYRDHLWSATRTCAVLMRQRRSIRLAIGMCRSMPTCAL